MSEMEIEPDSVDEQDELFHLRLALELLNVLAVLSIAANIFVSFVIVKYEKLRKDATNMLLLHVNIVQILFLSTTTTATRIFAVFDIDITSDAACLTYEVDTALVLCVFLLLILLTTGWYLKTYSEDKYPKFRRIYNFAAVAIYLLTIVVAYSTSNYCTNSNNFYAFTLQVCVVFSLVMIVFTIVMNVVHRVKVKQTTVKPPDNVGLAITNIFMLAWTTVYLPILWAILTDDDANILNVFIIVAVATCLATPIFNVFYLYRCNNFNVF